MLGAVGNVRSLLRTQLPHTLFQYHAPISRVPLSRVPHTFSQYRTLRRSSVPHNLSQYRTLLRSVPHIATLSTVHLNSVPYTSTLSTVDLHSLPYTAQEALVAPLPKTRTAHRIATRALCHKGNSAHRVRKPRVMSFRTHGVHAFRTLQRGLCALRDVSLSRKVSVQIVWRGCL